MTMRRQDGGAMLRAWWFGVGFAMVGALSCGTNMPAGPTGVDGGNPTLPRSSVCDLLQTQPTAWHAESITSVCRLDAAEGEFCAVQPGGVRTAQCTSVTQLSGGAYAAYDRNHGDPSDGRGLRSKN